MTLRQWLNGNTYYEEVFVYENATGREIGLWYGDEDRRYNLPVARVEPKYTATPWICAKLYIG